jgi:hypothetical protein
MQYPTRRTRQIQKGDVKKGERREDERRKEKEESFKIAFVRLGLPETSSTNVVQKDCRRSEGIRIHTSTER